MQQQQYVAQHRGTRGRCTFSPRPAMHELGEADSDVDCGDENEGPKPGVREVGKNGQAVQDSGGRAGGTLLVPARGTSVVDPCGL